MVKEYDGGMHYDSSPFLEWDDREHILQGNFVKRGVRQNRTNSHGRGFGFDHDVVHYACLLEEESQVEAVDTFGSFVIFLIYGSYYFVGNHSYIIFMLATWTFILTLLYNLNKNVTKRFKYNPIFLKNSKQKWMNRVDEWKLRPRMGGGAIRFILRKGCKWHWGPMDR